MAKRKRKTEFPKSVQPRSFSGVIRNCPRPIQSIAKGLRELVVESVPEVEERFSGGPRPIAMYRLSSDICWIQPHSKHCNLYLMRGHQLSDPAGILEGTSKRFKHAKIRTLEQLQRMPIREWLSESEALNAAIVGNGLSVEQVLDAVREICLALPKTKETLTWGIPHFRVGEKIFAGCGEDQGQPRIGLKMEREQSEMMMKLPGITKSPYSRPGDGWVTLDPNVFDDWEEIEDLLRGSFCLIAPKRVAALIE